MTALLFLMSFFLFFFFLSPLSLRMRFHMCIITLVISYGYKGLVMCNKMGWDEQKNIGREVGGAGLVYCIV